MTKRTPFEAGLIVATEEGRHLAEHGKREIGDRLKSLMLAADLEPPTEHEIEGSFQVRILSAADEMRGIALWRGLTPEQAEEVVGALLVAASAGSTQ